LAVTALLGALAVGSARKAGWFEGAVTPAVTDEEAISAAVYATMNAARAGDVSRYLSGYTGAMRVALERSLDDSGGAAFARYLQSLDAGVKGLAVSVEVGGGREAKARVEGVYQERNEVQVAYLEKEKGAWRIARTDGDQAVKAAIRYGTPIR
jgi:ketosteroid isomerase-like protein